MRLDFPPANISAAKFFGDTKALVFMFTKLEKSAWEKYDLSQEKDLVAC